jgi:chemotaxis response regulator CheB
MMAEPGDKRNVLVVDDARMMRMLVSQVLKEDGRYEVVGYCENGQQALEAIGKHKLDLIMVDIEMPVMDGLTFIRHARLKTRAKIVVLSSVAAFGSPKATEARKLGADAILHKPSGSVSMDLAQTSGKEILSTLRRLLP